MVSEHLSRNKCIFTNTQKLHTFIVTLFIPIKKRSEVSYDFNVFLCDFNVFLCDCESYYMRLIIYSANGILFPRQQVFISIACLTPTERQWPIFTIHIISYIVYKFNYLYLRNYRVSTFNILHVTIETCTLLAYPSPDMSTSGGGPYTVDSFTMRRYRKWHLVGHFTC